MNSCNTDRFLATTVVCGLSTLNVRYIAVYQIIYTGMFCSIHVIKYSVLINVILHLIM